MSSELSALPAVKIRGYYRYDSGSPYRVWTITADAPHVPAVSQWAGDVDGPAHAIAGDELWEDLEDGSEVFRMKRQDMVIGRPEWWQVEDLFGGVKPAWRDPRAVLEFQYYADFLTDDKPNGWKLRRWRFVMSMPELGIESGQVLIQAEPSRPLVGPTSFHVRDSERTPGSMRYLEQHEVDAIFGTKGPPEWQPPADSAVDQLAAVFETIARAAFNKVAAPATKPAPPPAVVAKPPLPSVPFISAAWLAKNANGVYRLDRKVDGVRLPAGSLLVCLPRNDSNPPADPTVTRATTRRLTKEELYALRTGWWCINKEASPLSVIVSKMAYDQVEWIEAYLRDARQWGLRRKKLVVDVCAIVPLPIEVPQPIEAASDGAALFELLAEVGGRLPSIRAAEGRES